MNHKIIEEMKAAPQWILHGAPGTTGKAAKTPFLPNGDYFKADPSKYVDYETATANCKRLKYVGVGYELLPGHNIIGIDLDHHFVGGQPDETALEFMNGIGSAGYWEFSPSGEGVHIFINGSIPEDFKNDAAGVEMYGGHATRYLTFTGNELALDLPEATDTAPALAALYEKYRTHKEYDTPAERKISPKLGAVMNREDTRLAIRQNIDMERFLKRSRGGLYYCPYCGSGNGPHHTGAFGIMKDKHKFHCFSCGKSGDVIDLYMKDTGKDYNAALQDLANELGITIKRDDAQSDFNDCLTAFNDYFDNKDAAEQKTPNRADSVDFSGYYEECKARLHDADSVNYITGRGISMATAEAYNMGYDPAADPTGTGHPTARVIIPVTPSHYVARRTDLEQDFRVMNSKGGEQGIFNLSALYSNNAVFVTEGPFDALSFIDVGFPAISINSADNVKKLLAQLDRQRTKATILIAMDNDEAGHAAAEELRAGCGSRNIPYLMFEYEHKDPNECLVRNPAGFSLQALDTFNRAERPDSTLDYIHHGMFTEIEAFQTKISTGFRKLDEKAGGLYSGLYVLGAVSSLGKTSFALQLADQVAANGTDVIFFSLEQSRLELVSKSLGRYTSLLGQEVNQLNIRLNAMATDPRSKEAFDKAANEYAARIGNRMNIIEANYACDVLSIGDYVRAYIERTGNRPFVVIDYLQALKAPIARPNMAPEMQERVKPLARAGVRELVDFSVTELKRLTRDLSIPVLAIASVNRANYMIPFDLESLKESGGIEYSADVVWGLQFHCLNDELFTKEGKVTEKRQMIADEKARTPRKLDLVCRKNRFGIGSFDIPIDFYPGNDLFMITNQFIKAPNFKEHDRSGKYNDLETIMKTL